MQISAYDICRYLVENFTDEVDLSVLDVVMEEDYVEIFSDIYSIIWTEITHNNIYKKGIRYNANKILASHFHNHHDFMSTVNKK